MSDKKYYQVIKPKCDTILHSSSPSGAAAKAYTHCIRSNSKKTQRRSHKIRLQRRSGNKKIYNYSVRQKKVDKVVVKDGIPINFRFKVKVKSLN
jgi:hypothetical protein